MCWGLTTILNSGEYEASQSGTRLSAVIWSSIMDIHYFTDSLEIVIRATVALSNGFFSCGFFNL
jgi:hypothetical protein